MRVGFLSLIFIPFLAQAGFIKSCRLVAEKSILMLGGNLSHSSRFSRVEHLTKSIDFKSIANLSLEMMEKYPTSEYFYIGIGRSPFPFMDFVEMLSPGSTLTVPVSYGKSGQRGFMSPGMMSFIDRFFDLKKLKGRKILLVDYTVSARSLGYFYGDFVDYLAAKKDQIPIELLFLSSSTAETLKPSKLIEDFEMKNIFLAPEQFHFIYVGEFGAHKEAGDALFSGVLAPFAPYGLSAQPQMGQFHVESNAVAHDAYLAALKEDYQNHVRQNSGFSDRIQKLIGRHKF